MDMDKCSVRSGPAQGILVALYRARRLREFCESSDQWLFMQIAMSARNSSSKILWVCVQHICIDGCSQKVVILLGCVQQAIQSKETFLYKLHKNMSCRSYRLPLLFCLDGANVVQYQLKFVAMTETYMLHIEFYYSIMYKLIK